MDLSMKKIYLHGFVPAIMEFAGWVLEEAVRAGKKRLYFLSRDGYQIYLAACKLSELRKLPVECRYLHVSRYAVRVPAYHLDMKSSLDWICANGIDVTLERILKRGALTDEEVLEVAGRILKSDVLADGEQHEATELKYILNRRQITELKEKLGNEPLFLQYVKSHSEEAYENTMGYLQQEGLLSDIPYAIVDSGWVGTFQQSLQLLVQSRRPDIRIEGYYFGLYEIPPGADACDYHGWYFTPRTGLKRKVYFSNSLFEAVCSADEGMTVGYDRKGGRYLPRLDPEGNPNGEKLQKNLEALERFLEGCTDAKKDKPGCTGDGKALVQKLFTLLMARPSMGEIACFEDFLFSDDVLTGNCQAVAARLTRKEIRNLYILHRLLILNGLGRGIIRESAWIEGSIVRLATEDRHYIRKSLRHIRWYKYLVYGRKQLKASVLTHSYFAR